MKNRVFNFSEHQYFKVKGWAYILSWLFLTGLFCFFAADNGTLTPAFAVVVGGIFLVSVVVCFLKQSNLGYQSYVAIKDGNIVYHNMRVNGYTLELLIHEQVCWEYTVKSIKRCRKGFLKIKIIGDIDVEILDITNGREFHKTKSVKSLKIPCYFDKQNELTNIILSQVKK